MCGDQKIYKIFSPHPNPLPLGDGLRVRENTAKNSNFLSFNCVQLTLAYNFL